MKNVIYVNFQSKLKSKNTNFVLNKFEISNIDKRIDQIGELIDLSNDDYELRCYEAELTDLMHQLKNSKMSALNKLSQTNLKSKRRKVRKLKLVG